MYRIVPDTAVSEQVAALPVEALAGYGEVLEVLQLTPWNGQPQHPGTRMRPFDVGRLAQVRPGRYLVLEELKEVHLLLVQWWG